ncbi:flagellar motor protein MotA [Thalassobaculum sp. OXR-137]|uniref:flagellar motor protein MotA n=1 Tax=Thalassobaculum sp. OXR-137 TaxID=3100173 RepID=UPI002AC8BCD8|nr:flagellar motor protein MotA [Thalassobaculum sp. OXR-137]WPZ36903.1 flagellar motor protein MotA [Thalassobaculum sp. OXR-137]
MTDPRRYLVRMIIFLVAVLVVAGVLFSALIDAFMANPALNGVILGVAVIGILFVFQQVFLLAPEAAWIDSFRNSMSMQRDPVLLAPVATLLNERASSGRQGTLSAMSLRSLLDSISVRLEESRDISRYLIGLLIFLGLLGTFWGLLRTVGAVSQVIDGLSIESGDLGAVFSDMKAGLQSPLAGMGTAFASSLFGLAGSLVLGFLDLQLGKAQNRFYNELEEWLSSFTRLGGSSLLGDGEHSATAYQQALMEQTAESLDKLQRIMSRGEDDRRSNNAIMVALVEQLRELTDKLDTDRDLLHRMVAAHDDLRPVLTRLADSSGGGRDEIVRSHLRNIEAYMARMLEDSGNGRAQMTEELRGEIRLVARTIAALAEEERRD